MTDIDIVIISNAANQPLFEMTNKCIDSLYKSECDFSFNVYLVESNKDAIYFLPGINVIYPDQPFGYNRYLNIGRKAGNANYVCLCNNDLYFGRGWASEIINAMNRETDLLSASPYCPNSHTQMGIKSNSGIIYGHDTRKLVTGWCIFQKRSLYEIIGDLDEDFIFWYADNDYGETLKYYKLKHALITSSHVIHMTSLTLNTKDHAEKRKLTFEQKRKFEMKWSRK